jgi:hypothetical protein
LGDRVEGGVAPILDGDACQLGARRPEVVHVAHRVHRVPGDGGEAEDAVEVDVADGPHRRHHVFRRVGLALHVDAQRQGYVCVT